MISILNKITNLITSIDFVQTEPVSDIVKETKYKVFFITDNNERISNENEIYADKKDIKTQNRIFRLRFNFKNRQYDKSRKYYIVVVDAQNGSETLRQEIVMDIAFSDDFGF